jgi:hypothetical protein
MRWRRFFFSLGVCGLVFWLTECKAGEHSPYEWPVEIAFTLALFTGWDVLIHGLPPLPSTAHLPSAMRIMIWTLWGFFGATIVAILVMDFAAGIVICPRPMGTRVLMWIALVAAMLGISMAELGSEQPD